MCTVTFIRVKDTFFITSSRDEKVLRSRALPPKMYRVNNMGLLFPKDGDAGGTWIALNENSNAAVLLNGAFFYHQSNPPYRRSRGLVLIDIIGTSTPVNGFLQMNLEAVEPFTLILLQDFKLYECRWDGEQKFSKPLVTSENYIWSSATLYDEATQKKRNEWFERWLAKNDKPSLENIFHFHQFAGDGDTQNDIRMNRGGHLFTVSIAAIQITRDSASMHYLDLLEGASLLQKQEHTLTVEL